MIKQTNILSSLYKHYKNTITLIYIFRLLLFIQIKLFGVYSIFSIFEV